MASRGMGLKLALGLKFDQLEDDVAVGFAWAAQVAQLAFGEKTLGDLFP